MPKSKPPPNNPPPDLILFVASKLGDPPVEIAHAEHVYFTRDAATIRLKDAPPGYGSELGNKLRDAFPDLSVTVI